MWPYFADFQVLVQYWMLDWIKDHLIHLTIVNREDYF